MGSLYRENNNLIFENINGKKKIPINTVESLFLLNEISFNSKLIGMLNEYGITIHLFNYYGKYQGTFFPKNVNRSGKILLKQVACYNSNKRLDISKNIVKGIANNIKFLMYHYYRHGDKVIKQRILNVDEWIKWLEKSNTISSVMMVEGKIWMELYQSLNILINNKDFEFSTRNKRPATNEVNAVISFLNSLLYSETITSIAKTNLDQSISFLHTPADGRFSLSLDLSEVFKPIITFRIMLSLINNRRLRVNEHFVKEMDGCLLNEDGRKIILKAFDEKMSEIIYNTKIKRNMTYRTLIKYEGYKLLKSITEDIEFIPFNIEEGR